jgi:hypothetical protein
MPLAPVPSTAAGARVPCDAGVSTVGGVTFSGASSKAACLDVAAVASNPDKQTLYNADVFGRVG